MFAAALKSIAHASILFPPHPPLRELTWCFCAAFMMYMMGSGVHIMNIIFTVYQLIGPIKSMFSMNQGMPSATSPLASPFAPDPLCCAVFKGVSEAAKDLGVDLTLHKLVFIACQLGVLLFITYRLRHSPSPHRPPSRNPVGPGLWSRRSAGFGVI